MKNLIILLILVTINLTSFSQDLDSNFNDCWIAYKTEPFAEDNCPAMLCPNGEIYCFIKVDKEVYKSIPGWTLLSEDRMRFDGDNPTYFKVLKWTDDELIIETESNPILKIYFRKQSN